MTSTASSLGFLGLNGLDLLRSSLLGLRRSLLSSLALLLEDNRLGDKLHDDHGSVVALAEAELHDAGVAARTILEHALLDLLEDLANKLFIVQVSDGETTGVQVAALRPRDDLIDIAADLPWRATRPS